MNANHLATIVYGALTLILTLCIAIAYSDFVAAIMVAGAAGATYVFQVAQEDEHTPPFLLIVLWAIVVILTVGAWIKLCV